MKKCLLKLSQKTLGVHLNVLKLSHHQIIKRVLPRHITNSFNFIKVRHHSKGVLKIYIFTTLFTNML